MQGYKLTQIMNPFFDMPETYEETVKVYRTLAKSADQRLVRLESYEHDPNFRNATQYAYARAMRDIKSWSGDQAQRFNTAPPKSMAALQAKIEDIKTFLSAPTSTKKGIKDIYVRRANTINKKYGTNFKWNELGDFFESSLNELMDNDFGSETKMDVIANIRKNKDEIIKKINENKARDIKESDQKMVDKLTEDFIKEHGEEVLKYLEAM